MTKFIMRWIINAIAIFLAVKFVPGIHLESGLLTVVWLALIFGLLNAFLRPLLTLLTCPLIILTLGLFTFLINAFLFWLTGQVGHLFGILLTFDGFWPILLGALVISVVSILLSLILKDELHGAHPHS
jgi:putative membrane protein